MMKPGLGRQNVFVHARPHPNPLPRGEGTTIRAAGKFVRLACNRRCFLFATRTALSPDASDLQRRGERFPLSLEERAGVRTVVELTFRLKLT